MHSGLCEQYVKSPGLVIWLPVSHAPSCIGTSNPVRTGLNPLSQFSQLSFMQCMGLCIFSLPVSLMMIFTICVLYLVSSSKFIFYRIQQLYRNRKHFVNTRKTHNIETLLHSARGHKKATGLIKLATKNMWKLKIVIKSEVWLICHCFGSDHEMMVCAVCLYLFVAKEAPGRSTFLVL